MQNMTANSWAAVTPMRGTMLRPTDGATQHAWPNPTHLECQTQVLEQRVQQAHANVSVMAAKLLAGLSNRQAPPETRSAWLGGDLAQMRVADADGFAPQSSHPVCRDPSPPRLSAAPQFATWAVKNSVSLTEIYSEKAWDREELSSTKPPSEGTDTEEELALQKPGLEISGEQKRTTLMIRNVPVTYTQDMLTQAWPVDGTYDFLYLPRATESNLSYAFVNFVSEEHAAVFKARWHGARLAHHNSRKPLNISYADVQGLAANLHELKKKRARRMQTRQCEPIVVVGGRQVSYKEAFDMIVCGVTSGAAMSATVAMSKRAVSSLEPGDGLCQAPLVLPIGPPPGLELPARSVRFPCGAFSCAVGVFPPSSLPC